MSAPIDEEATGVADLIRASDGTSPVGIRWLGNGYAWLVQLGDQCLLLKRGRPEQDQADVAWEHEYLRRLKEAGFPASVPVPAFEGQSWTRFGGRIWATLSYLPGHTLATERSPDFEAAGAFLARYHRAAHAILAPTQRPTEPGLLPLRQVTPLDRLGRAPGDADALERFADLLDDLEAGLAALRYQSIEHLVIHGDATNDNLIVDGTPPRIVGLIDFGAAHLAPWLSDLAAALWRSARPDPESVEYDPHRIGRFVLGYHREAPISRELVRAIPLLMQGRGLQLISRRMRRLQPGQPIAAISDVALTLRRTEWLQTYRADLADTVASVVS